MVSTEPDGISLHVFCYVNQLSNVYITLFEIAKTLPMKMNCKKL